MTGLLTRLLGRLPIGWMQLLHNRTRLIAAVGGVTFANVLIFMQLGFMNALFETSVFTHRSFEADMVLVSSDFRSLREANPLPRARMFQALSHQHVQTATAVYVGTRTWTDTEVNDTTNFRVIGVNPDASVFRDRDLAEQLSVLRQPDTALVDARTRQLNPGVLKDIASQGQRMVEIEGRSLSLLGTFSAGASFDVDGALVVSEQTFFRLFPNRSAHTPTVILLTTEAEVDGRNLDRELLAAELNAQFPEQDTLALTRQGFIDAEQDYQATQTPIGFVFGFGVSIGLVVGLVIVYQVLSTDVQDHLSEYATFKAIGYPPRFFLGIVLEEAVSLAALGFVPGMAICLVMYQFAADRTGLPIRMTLLRPVGVFTLTVLMCLLSGFIATRRLNSADPAELF